MKKILVCSLLLSSLLSTQSSAAITDEKSPADVFSSSRYDWMTDGLDMQGGGTTWAEMMADTVINKIEAKWRTQSDVRKTFQAALTDPLFRSAADELIRQSPDTFVTAWTLINTHMENPVVQSAFNNYGVLTGTMELSFSIEKEKLGFLEQVYGGPIDVRSAVIRLWRSASSPAEERLRYSAAYRYGID